jgi:hypothetical protein
VYLWELSIRIRYVASSGGRQKASYRIKHTVGKAARKK